MLSRRIYCVSLAAGVLVCPRAAQAQTQKPVAQLRESQVEVGEEAVLEVVVPLDSPNADVGQPNVRGPKGLRVRSLGTSLSQRMVQDNGRVSMSIMRSFSYSLSADQPGKYPLAIEMRLGDKRQKITPAPELVVTKEARRPAQPEIQDDADQRVIIELSKHEVYVGEPILYSCEIWDRGGGQLGMEKAPTFRDFWVEDLAPGQQRMERGDFGSFFVIPIRRAIISPQKTGKLTLASPAFVVQQSRFGSPRLRGRPRQHRLVGKEQVIEVKPLLKRTSINQGINKAFNHLSIHALVELWLYLNTNFTN